MSKVQELEQIIERLPAEQFQELATWIDQKRRSNDQPTRDHQAFLNSYSPQDEGLYDDAATR